METYITSKRFLIDTLHDIDININDLMKWTAYNDDEYADEIAAFKTQFEQLKEKMEKKS